MQFMRRAIKGSSRRWGMPVSIIVLIYIAVGSRKGQYTSKRAKTRILSYMRSVLNCIPDVAHE